MRKLKLFLGRSSLLALIFAAVGCTSGGGLAVDARRQAARITGSYQASFTTRNGVSREGTLKIAPMGKLLYWLEWRDSHDTYSGRGALAGEALLAVWGSNKSRCLAAMLDVDPDGTLTGIWFRAEDRNGATSSIEAIPQNRGGGQLGGVYSIRASDAAAANLPRQLEVSSLGGQFYRFLWRGDEQLEGSGRLRDGMILVVAAVVGSGDKCRISEMTLAEDGSLSWTWLADP